MAAEHDQFTLLKFGVHGVLSTHTSSRRFWDRYAAASNVAATACSGAALLGMSARAEMSTTRRGHVGKSTSRLSAKRRKNVPARGDVVHGGPLEAALAGQLQCGLCESSARVRLALSHALAARDGSNCHHMG